MFYISFDFFITKFFGPCEYSIFIFERDAFTILLNCTHILISSLLSLRFKLSFLYKIISTM
jgi:hypothetical protein